MRNGGTWRTGAATRHRDGGWVKRQGQEERNAGRLAGEAGPSCSCSGPAALGGPPPPLPSSSCFAFAYLILCLTRSQKVHPALGMRRAGGGLRGAGGGALMSPAHFVLSLADPQSPKGTAVMPGQLRVGKAVLLCC